MSRWSIKIVELKSFGFSICLVILDHHPLCVPRDDIIHIERPLIDITVLKPCPFTPLFNIPGPEQYHTIIPLVVKITIIICEKTVSVPVLYKRDNLCELTVGRIQPGHPVRCTTIIDTIYNTGIYQVTIAVLYPPVGLTMKSIIVISVYICVLVSLIPLQVHIIPEVSFLTPEQFHTSTDGLYDVIYTIGTVSFFQFYVFLHIWYCSIPS